MNVKASKGCELKMKIKMVTLFSWYWYTIVLVIVDNICQERWSWNSKNGFYYFSGELLFGKERLIQKTDENEACDLKKKNPLNSCGLENLNLANRDLH